LIKHLACETAYLGLVSDIDGRTQRHIELRYRLPIEKRESEAFFGEHLRDSPADSLRRPCDDGDRVTPHRARLSRLFGEDNRPGAGY
jgi:hypothetical protein